MYFRKQHNISQVAWINGNLKIIDKDSKLVSLNPNVGQLMLQNTIELQLKRGLPVRIILLKPRQVGWSTWTQALCFEYVNRHSNVTAQAVSADQEATDHIFRISKLFQQEMPLETKLPTISSNRREIAYASPHRSRLIIQTAGKDALGIGTTVKFFHSSETSKWPNAAEGLAAALQQVPNKPDTYVILESTANGAGGTFYEMFWEAVERLKTNPDDYRGYLPVFFPWHKFPEYTSSVPEGFEADEEESDLKDQYGLTDGQLVWRRFKIQEVRGDKAKFCEQYPLTPDEAFQASGNPVFPASVLEVQNKRVVKNLRKGLFFRDKGKQVRFESVNRLLDCWFMSAPPTEGDQYTMGIDTMEGRISDYGDSKSPLDFHGVAILNRNARRYDCIYKGRGNQQELGEQCLLAAEFYNNAFVGPEVPSGIVVLNVFKQAGYENVYNRQIHDEQYVEEDTETLGWRTTMITRKWLVEQFLVSVQEESPLTITFQEIINEMRSFVRNKDGKATHASGKHDDVLFGAMIALQLHLRCPIDNIAYGFTRTGIYSFPETIQRDLNEIGAIDLGCEDELVSEFICDRTI